MADTLLQMQKSYNDPVLNNNSILFDEVINFDGDLAYNPFNGEVGILATGLYLIDWFVAPQSAPGVTSVMFKLISSTGQEFESNLPSKTGNMCGMAVIDVETAPVTIKLVNRSNTTVYFSDAVHAKSNLRVVRIDRIASDNSRCFAMDQFTHVLEQLVDLYAGKTVMIFFKACSCDRNPSFTVQSAGYLICSANDNRRPSDCNEYHSDNRALFPRQHV